MSKTIINGIDVSECEFYAETRKLSDNLNGGYYIEHYYCDLQGDNYCICNKNPNCYFKKFKRLQEENKELKEEITKFRWDNPYYVLYNNVVGQRDNLERENEELRQVTKNHPDIQEPYIYLYRQIKKQCHKLEEENEELKARFNELYNNSEQLANKYNKYGGNKENELVEIINKTADKRNKYKQALEEIREIAKHWLNNDWSCYHCRSNMDEKLKEIIKLTRF